MALRDTILALFAAFAVTAGLCPYAIPFLHRLKFGQQVRDDGTEEVNLIHVTPDGFYMESSTCENQDCVDQGMVTLENRDSRILYNAVLCLPNMVSLALYTPEEILEMYASAPAPADDAETADENNQ